MDHACHKRIARNTVAWLVYGLLASQVVILVVGFGSACLWRAWRRRRDEELARAGMAPEEAQFLLVQDGNESD